MAGLRCSVVRRLDERRRRRRLNVVGGTVFLLLARSSRIPGPRNSCYVIDGPRKRTNLVMIYLVNLLMKYWPYFMVSFPSVGI